MTPTLPILIALFVGAADPLEVSPVERAMLDVIPSIAHMHGCLDESRLESLRLQAIVGDAASSYELATHHGNCEHGVLQHYLFYLRLAAEQGNCDALYEFAQQQNRGYVEALKTPGDWKERARQCSSPSPHTER